MNEVSFPLTTDGLESLLFAAGFVVRAPMTIRLLHADDLQGTLEVTHPGSFKKDRTAVAGGLFCPRVFGSESNRFAHIALPAPVLHPWAIDAAAELLKVDAARIKEVMGGTKTIDGKEADDYRSTGSLSIHSALSQLDLETLSKNSMLARSLLKTDRVATDLCFSRWPVLAPNDRPYLGSARSDLNSLYTRLFNRCSRLRRLLELDAPDIILRNEFRLLHAATFALLDNAQHTTTPATQRPLRSLVDLLHAESVEPSTTLPRQLGPLLMRHAMNF